MEDERVSVRLNASCNVGRERSSVGGRSRSKEN